MKIDKTYSKAYWRAAKCMEAIERLDIAITQLQNAAENGAFDITDQSSAFTKYYNKLREDEAQFKIYAKNDPTRNMFKVHMDWIK